MQFAPVTFLARLAALVPRPRINLILYYGVLGARAAWRPDVVPGGAAAPVGAPEPPRAHVRCATGRRWFFG